MQVATPHEGVAGAGFLAVPGGAYTPRFASDPSLEQSARATSDAEGGTGVSTSDLPSTAAGRSMAPSTVASSLNSMTDTTAAVWAGREEGAAGRPQLSRRTSDIVEQSAAGVLPAPPRAGRLLGPRSIAVGGGGDGGGVGGSGPSSPS